MSLNPAFLQDIDAALGPAGWSQSADQLQAAATPWRGTYRGHTPLLLLPASTAEVSEAVRLCARYGLAITPQGGNTGLVDGGTPHGEVTLSLRRMQAVRDVDPINNSLTIEAGAILTSAQHAAQSVNRFFPLSLGSEGSATIGGLISTNAGGVAVLRYGMMRDLLLGLEVVLANGDVVSQLSGLRKNNTGYDLKHLFAGAEGTLGIITAATLKLYPQTARASAWISCQTSSDVVALLALMRDQLGDTVTSFEMIPANAIEMVLKDRPGTRDPNPSQHAWRVLCEVSLAQPDLAQTLLEKALTSALDSGLAVDAVLAQSDRQARDFWTLRESIPLSKRAYGRSLNHDIAVPVSRIADFLHNTEEALKKLLDPVEIVAFGHVGDGNLHYSVCEAETSSAQQLVKRADEITATIHRSAQLYGGSISAEHGVGRLKRDELEASRPAAATAVMKAIKQALDPEGRFNPDRVIASAVRTQTKRTDDAV